jgi:hypothetical protein
VQVIEMVEVRKTSQPVTRVCLCFFDVA